MKNSKSIDRVIQVNDIDIGKNITLLRKSMHIKQTDMVARLQIMGIDISIYSYNRVEKGKQNPTVSFLYEHSFQLSHIRNHTNSINTNTKGLA